LSYWRAQLNGTALRFGAQPMIAGAVRDAGDSTWVTRTARPTDRLVKSQGNRSKLPTPICRIPHQDTRQAAQNSTGRVALHANRPSVTGCPESTSRLASGWSWNGPTSYVSIAFCAERLHAQGFLALYSKSAFYENLTAF